MKNTNLLRKVLLLIVFISLLGLATLAYAGFAYAQKLARESITTNLRALIEADQVLYYTSTIYQRTDPKINDPPDPYHLSIIPFYTGNQITERWITQDTLKERTEIGAGNQKILSWEFILTTDSISFYDALSGVANVSERQPQTQDDENSIPLDEISWIAGTRKTQWGREAWVIKFLPESALPTDFSIETGSLMDQGPFGNDLRFNQVQWEWEIDQETGLMVSRILLALTSDGPVILYSEHRSEPKIMLISELPIGWDQLSISSEEMADLMKSDSEVDTLVNTSSEWTPETLSATVDFDFYLPKEAILSKYGFDWTYITYRPGQIFDLPPVTFEIYQSAANGIGAEIIYNTRNPVDDNHPQSLRLLEAPKDQLVSLLQQSPPVWLNSHSIKLIIREKEQEVWIVSEGLLRESGNNPLIGLFIELNNTLIYLEGQNISEQEMLVIGESLQLVNEYK